MVHKASFGATLKGDESLPSLVLIAEWPNGTKAWRVMTEAASSEISNRLFRKTDFNVTRWKDLGYDEDECALFLFTVQVVSFKGVPFDAEAVLVSARDVQNNGMESWVIKQVWALRDTFFVDDLSSGLSAKVAWFLSSVLKLDLEGGLLRWATGRYRFQIPVPMPDEWFDLARMPEIKQRRDRQSEIRSQHGKAYLSTLKAWEESDRFPLEFFADSKANKREIEEEVVAALSLVLHSFEELPDHWDGPFNYVHGSGRNYQVEIGYMQMRFHFDLNPLQGLLWTFEVVFNSVEKGSVTVALGSVSEPSPLKALQHFRIVWPESDHDAMLDRWLSPGRVVFDPVALEAFSLLDAFPPFLWSPRRFWGWAKGQEGVS